MKLQKLFTLFVLVSLFAAGTISCGDPAGPDPDSNEVVDPSKPDTPDTPDNPENPDTPDNPDDPDQPEGDNKINGYEFVDLGLSVKWATCNVGAENPEDYGNYYAWGETEAIANYNSWSGYKWGNGSQKALTKYCTLSTYGKKDGLGTLELEDDAARVNCGGTWRMPTSTECKELLKKDNCDWKWTTVNDVYGYLVTSKITGYTDKSIFLPAAGYSDGYVYKPVKAGQSGFYWSSSLHLAEPIFAYDLNFGKDYASFSSEKRYLGFSVRPVTE